MNSKKIFLANDHAGFEMKNFFKSKLLLDSFDIEDFGNNVMEILDDYPDFMHPAAEEFSKSLENNFMLVFGGSGVGESVLLNRYSGLRSIPVFVEDIKLLENVSSHDNINSLAFGTRFVSNDFAYEVFKYFISCHRLKEEKYLRRISKIDKKVIQ